MNRIDFKNFQLKENLDMPLEKLLSIWDELETEFDKNWRFWDKFPAISSGDENIAKFIKNYKDTLLQMSPACFTISPYLIIFWKQHKDPSSQRWEFKDDADKQFKSFLQKNGLPTSGDTLKVLVPITHLFHSEEHLKFYDEYMEKQRSEQEAIAQARKESSDNRKQDVINSLNVFIND